VCSVILLLITGTGGGGVDDSVVGHNMYNIYTYHYIDVYVRARIILYI